MTVLLNPYLSFRNSARAAMEMYHSVFGGELNISTFGEMGMSQSPADADLVVHSILTGDNGMVIMGADTPQGMDLTAGSNYSISLSGDDDGALRGYWSRLIEGGVIVEPLETAPWGDSFGMCVDRFGVNWMVNIAAVR